MIFRAPAGYHLLSKEELVTIIENIQKGGLSDAIQYMEHCLDEINFYDEIRRKTELKKMLKEDGDLQAAASLEAEMKETVRQRVETSKLLKSDFLNKM